MECEIRLTGTKPLLMHQDNVMFDGKIKEWQKDPDNKGLSVSGDDRSPAWTWLGAMYHDGKHITVPSDNVMTMLREGGTQVLVPNAKGNKTFKAQTQSGIVPVDADFVLDIDGEIIPVDTLLELEGNNDFAAHVETVQDHGFDLLVKRARIGQSKHIRVRPIFRQWSITGRLLILDDQITMDVLKTILRIAGTTKGICDWRPSSRTPGGFGTFTAEIEVIDG